MRDPDTTSATSGPSLRLTLLGGFDARLASASPPGLEAWAMYVLAETATRAGGLDDPTAREAYAAAHTLARELGLRPLEAACHLGLGRLLTGGRDATGARAALLDAARLFRALSMPAALAESEAVLARAGGRME